MRKFVLLIVVSAIVGLGLSATTANAAIPKHDATNDSVYCADVIGKIAFGTAMTFGGTTPTTATITIKSTDCVDETAGLYDQDHPNGVALKGVSIKGTWNLSGNDCSQFIFGLLQTWNVALTVHGP